MKAIIFAVLALALVGCVGDKSAEIRRARSFYATMICAERGMVYIEHTNAFTGDTYACIVSQKMIVEKQEVYQKQIQKAN